MSLLIRALKQAERDHQARVSGTEAAPAEADRHGEAPGAALQLEPFDGAAAANSEHAPAREQAACAAPPTAPSTSPAAVTRSQPAETALPVVASTAQPAAGPFLASVMTAAASASTQSLVHGPAPMADAPARSAAEPAPAAAAESAPAAVGSVDADADRREAARFLVAPGPDRRRVRRQRVLAGALVGLVCTAIGLAYWQYGAQYGLADLPDYPRRAQAPVALGTNVAPSPNGNPNAINAPSATNHSPQQSARPATHATPRPAAPPAEANVAAAKAGASSTAMAGADGPTDHPAGTIHFRPPELASDKVHTLLQEAYAAAARGDAIAARKQYEHVIEVDPNNGDAWIGLATLAANSGDAANANRSYRHALEIDPSDGVALAGLLGLQTGVDPQEYESRLRQLIARDGTQPALQAALGKLLARQGRWLEAQEAFFQAWTADPSQADVAFNLAVSLERIRQSDAAIAYYRRALLLTQERPAHFDRAVAGDRVAALLATSAPAPDNGGKAQSKAPAVTPKK